VDKVVLSVVVRLSRSFLSRSFFDDDNGNGTAAENIQFVFRHITALAVWCLITTLELSFGTIEEQDAERLAGVRQQCLTLDHLDLSYSIRSNQPGQRDLQECWGSAQR
jgi:hypothetical protein